MCHEISVPLNTSYWDKPWQAHVVNEVDGTLQEERRRRRGMGRERRWRRRGKEREKGRKESRGGGEEDGKRRERRARYVCQCVVNGYH